MEATLRVTVTLALAWVSDSLRLRVVKVTVAVFPSGILTILMVSVPEEPDNLLIFKSLSDNSAFQLTEETT